MLIIWLVVTVGAGGRPGVSGLPTIVCGPALCGWTLQLPVDAGVRQFCRVL